MKPQRIQLSRKKGFNLQKASLKLNGLSAVKCARPSKWGNPFPINKDRSVFQAVREFEKMLSEGNNPPFTAANIHSELCGKNLACWCADSPCHCDVLLEIANS